MTPFQALYGREPPTIARYILGSTASELVDSYLLQRDEVLKVLKNNLLKAQNRMKLLADKSRKNTVLEVGDWAYVKLKPFKQNALRLQQDHKLGRHYFGPYQVLKRIGSVAYRLELSESAKIHSVFHISMLKRCVGTSDQQVTPLHLNIPTTENPADSNLEDKVALQEGSNVVNENIFDWDATRDEHMGLPRRTSRKLIPPKRLGDYIWKGASSREEGIQLPLEKELWALAEQNFPDPERRMRYQCMSRAVLSASPFVTSYYVLVVSYYANYRPSILQPIPGPSILQPIVVKATKLVHFGNTIFGNQGYLIELSGALLTIFRFRNVEGCDTFKVFEIDVNKVELKEINTLRDYAIFVGLNGAICIDSSKFTKVKSNHIYFTDLEGD
ncbi:hypothetical protein T459_22599 [Capsicum annuum]|uniref:Uncharacterized protein n=1 Tax=Capsicum annuum TaxID=4072 RepID=A0A2G2YQ31_CAPAN|nr:hypothetical protein T459_22599 [Capsicum annuum]